MISRLHVLLRLCNLCPVLLPISFVLSLPLFGSFLFNLCLSFCLAFFLLYACRSASIRLIIRGGRKLAAKKAFARHTTSLRCQPERFHPSVDVLTAEALELHTRLARINHIKGFGVLLRRVRYVPDKVNLAGGSIRLIVVISKGVLVAYLVLQVQILKDRSLKEAKGDTFIDFSKDLLGPFPVSWE